MSDMVNHPDHYQSKSGLECIDAIEAMLESKNFTYYLQGNVFKYLWRWRTKNGVQDLKKARWYLNKLIDIVNPQFKVGDIVYVKLLGHEDYVKAKIHRIYEVDNEDVADVVASDLDLFAHKIPLTLLYSEKPERTQ